MALHKDEAIILLKRAYGESDRIIHLFTLQTGKVAAIAKGAGKSQKRFMNTLEPFNHIRFEYFDKHGRGMVRIENADLVVANNGIETSIRKACAASFFAEFVDRLTKEREPHAQLFHALKRLIDSVRVNDPTYVDILHHQLCMLETLGYHPNLDTCVYCGSDMTLERKVNFSKERGGILCGACARSLPHRVCREEAIPGLIAARGTCGGFDSRAVEREVQEIMEGFITYHIDVDFKSYRLLKAMVF